jgi:hypothetical protein
MLLTIFLFKFISSDWQQTEITSQHSATK